MKMQFGLGETADERRDVVHKPSVSGCCCWATAG
jgi:hypothetical protein